MFSHVVSGKLMLGISEVCVNLVILFYFYVCLRSSLFNNGFTDSVTLGGALGECDLQYPVLINDL